MPLHLVTRFERPGLCHIDSCIEWLDALDAAPRHTDNPPSLY
jgi:hypothetical protein